MKAVICHKGKLSLENVPDPRPAKGQVLIEVSRCGICGSDLHAKNHSDYWSSVMSQSGLNGFMSSEQKVIMGHEFCGEILDFGKRGSKQNKIGTRISALPILPQKGQIDMIGYSERTSGAYAERMLVDELLIFPIPNGLSDDIAVLTEPVAVGLHAVNRADIRRKDVAIVIGCGPIGLATIAVLKAKGVKTVLASDFSSGRRTLAKQSGADIVVNPAEMSPFADRRDYEFTMGMQDNMEVGLDARVKMENLPFPWWHVWGIADKLGLATPKRPVIFECVGLPGMLRSLTAEAPMYSRIIAVGVCMESDTLEPAVIQNKELDLRFVFGYTPLEFHDALKNLANGKIKADPMITGTVGLAGIDKAFKALADPERHAKILIDPKSEAMKPI